MRSELDESFVYPGHPLVIAFAITEVFPDYGAAAERTEPGPGNYTCSKAAASRHVRGAGSHVGAAMDFFQFLREGVAWEKAVEWADNLWRDFTEGTYAQRTQKGQEHADTIKPLLRAKEIWWAKR